MSDYELEPIIRKRHQFRKLLLARERVKRLERELRGDPVQPEDPPYVPQFLRARLENGLTHSKDAALPLLRDETAALAATAVQSLRPSLSTHGVPAPRRLRLIAGSSARRPELVELQPEPCL